MSTTDERTIIRNLVIQYCPEYLVYFCHPTASLVAPHLFRSKVIEGYALAEPTKEFDKEAWEQYCQIYLDSIDKCCRWLEPFWTFEEEACRPMSVLYSSGLGEFILGDLMEHSQMLFSAYLLMLEDGYHPKVHFRLEAMKNMALEVCMGRRLEEEEDELDYEMVDLNDDVPEEKLVDIPRPLLPFQIHAEPDPLLTYAHVFHKRECPVAADQIAWDLGSPLGSSLPMWYIGNFQGLDAIQLWKQPKSIYPLLQQCKQKGEAEMKLYDAKSESLREIILCVLAMGGAWHDIVRELILKCFYAHSGWFVPPFNYNEEDYADLGTPVFPYPAVNMATVALAPEFDLNGEAQFAPHGVVVSMKGAVKPRRTKIRVPGTWAGTYLFLSDAPWPKLSDTRWSMLSPVVEATCQDYMLISFMTLATGVYVVSVDQEGAVVGSVLLPNQAGDFNNEISLNHGQQYFGLQMERPQLEFCWAKDYLTIKDPVNQELFYYNTTSSEQSGLLQVKTKFGFAVLHPNATLHRRLCSTPKVIVRKDQFDTCNTTYRPLIRNKKSKDGVFQSFSRGGMVRYNRMWGREGGDVLITSFFLLTQDMTAPAVIKTKALFTLIAHCFYRCKNTIRGLIHAVELFQHSVDQEEWTLSYPYVVPWVVSAMKSLGKKTSPLPQNKAEVKHWINECLLERPCYIGECVNPECRRKWEESWARDVAETMEGIEQG